MSAFKPIQKRKIIASFSVAWDKTIDNKQTLFPVYGDKENRKPQRGCPPDGESYTLRATKGVNMHPFPIIKLENQDGTKYAPEEDIKLTLVCASDKLPPPVGSCTCGGVPILTESKKFQLNTDSEGNVFSKIRGGVLELIKVQIGCCTGLRGHNCPLALKVEFVGEGSPLAGQIIYSVPIDVGAKGPFAKVFTKNNPEEFVHEVKETSPPNSVSAPHPTYEGAEEMIALLKKLNLQKYTHLFTAQEVDIQAFLQLTDEDLTEIGINKVGPKVKILKEIARLRESRTLLAPPPTFSQVPALPQPPVPQIQTTPAPPEEPLLPSISASLDRIESTPSLTSLSSPMLASFFQDDGSTGDQPSKRRKLLGSFASCGSLADMASELPISMYLYLSNIVASNNILKKTLFMVKSEKNKWETEQIVQQIQQQVVNDLTQKGKYVFHEGKAQLMLLLQPDKVGDWVAKSAYSDQIWNFKKGDYIKIDNHHNVDISINVHYYYIPSASKSNDKLFIEEFRSPKKYPTLFPGGSLEIGVDENRDGRLALAAELDFEPSETFAVTKNGKLMFPVTQDSNMFNETCNFSFKRRKDNMKKAESFDDFQKEIFLSKCLDPTML